MFLRRRAREHVVTSNVQLLKLFLADTSCFPLIVVVEAFTVYQDLYDDVSLATLDKVVKLNAVRQRWLCHIH